jgi:hypothetical protein
MPAPDPTSRASAVTVPLHRGALARSAIGSWVLQVATAAALGIDAAVHWQNASAYDAVRATVSQGQLPDMYENTWQVPGKLLSAYAEAAAVLLAAPACSATAAARRHQSADG